MLWHVIDKVGVHLTGDPTRTANTEPQRTWLSTISGNDINYVLLRRIQRN